MSGDEYPYYFVTKVYRLSIHKTNFIPHQTTVYYLLQVFGDAHAARVGLLVLSCQLLFCVIVVMFVTQKAREHLDIAITSQKVPKELQLPLTNKIDILVMPKSDQKFEQHRKTLSM